MPRLPYAGPIVRTSLHPAVFGAALVALLMAACTDDKPVENTTDPTVPSAPVLASSGGSLNVNLDQCANLSTPCAWQNGNLNGNNSAYAEGDVVPFRLAIEGLAPGQHSIHINYDFTAGGNKAYDFLASVDATETTSLCAAGGGAVSSLCASGLPSPNAASFPADNFNDPNDGSGSVSQALGASGLSGSAVQLRIYGGTIVTISNPVHSGPPGGNSTVDMTVTFTSTGSAVLLVWGGHLAKSSFWKNADNTPDGAAQVSGSPWHMRTQQLDGSGNKNQDRSIQPSAITETHPSVSITKTPSVTQVCTNGNTSVTYTYVVNNTGDVPLSGSVSDDNGTPSDATDDIAVGTFSNLAAGASVTFTKSRAINATTTNVATVTASDGSVTVSGTASATVTAVACGVSITKTPSVTNVCSNGNNSVTYTYVVTNNSGGSFTASGSVSDDNGTSSDATDDIAVGTFTNLAAGSSQTFTHTRTITSTTTNVATVSATVNGQSVTATASATVTAHSCGLTLAKTPSVTQVCSGSGTSVTYTYRVTNSGDFFDASGTLVDDNGTPNDATDDFTVGSWGPLAAGAHQDLQATRTVSSTKTNTATASGTAGGVSVSATASATVTAVVCGTGQLAPTQTTCEQFATGTAPELELLTSVIKGGVINNVAPGVFFYYAKITVPAGNLTVGVNQTITAGNTSLPDFQVQNGQAYLYRYANGACSTVLTLSGLTDPSGTLSNAPAGDYIIGVKYGTSAVVGQNVGGGPSGSLISTYSFSLLYGGSVVQGTTDSDNLVRK